MKKGKGVNIYGHVSLLIDSLLTKSLWNHFFLKNTNNNDNKTKLHWTVDAKLHHPIINGLSIHE